MKSLITALILTISVITPSIAQVSPDEAPSNVQQFLINCSGINPDMAEEAGFVATLSCASLIRGVVEGHRLTIASYGLAHEKFAQANPDVTVVDIGFRPMWCVGLGVDNRTLVNVVLQWITVNGTRAEQISAALPGSGGALATTFLALIETFPCRPSRQ
jgi:hypothetical protein